MYRILAAMEESGQARRGYVVEGLGAAQFAMEGAVDRLRAVANARERGDGRSGRTVSTGGGPGAASAGSGPPAGPGGHHLPAPYGDDFPNGDGFPGTDGAADPAGFPDFPDPDGSSDPHGPGRSPSRGDYISPLDYTSPRDYAEPGAGGPRGGGTQGGFGGWRGPYDTGHPGRRGRPAEGPQALVLAAADPANSYGAALPWPEPPAGATHKPGRKAGSLVVLVEGEPALYMERGGKTLLLWPSDPDALPAEDPRLRAATEALAAAARAGSLGTVTVERVNGAAALTSPFGPLLEEAGFIATPRGLRIRA